jgi:hypothetical protein
MPNNRLTGSAQRPTCDDTMPAGSPPPALLQRAARCACSKSPPLDATSCDQQAAAFPCSTSSKASRTLPPAVTRRLNASPWRPRGGSARWSPSSVGAILTNEVYIGISYYNRRRWIESDRTDPSIRKNRKTKSVLRPREEWITISVPPLIDEATFLACSRFWYQGE